MLSVAAARQARSVMARVSLRAVSAARLCSAAGRTTTRLATAARRPAAGVPVQQQLRSLSSLAWSPSRLSVSCVSSVVRSSRSFASSASKPPHSVSDPPLPAAADAHGKVTETTTVGQPFTPTLHEGKPIALLTPVESWGVKRSRLWASVKAEAKHYWLGTKLLWVEIRIAARMLRQIANGHEMTRRERKQLLRTSADLVRMVPFIVILVVPFAEFALPILLKFFPNMLPSTYLDSSGAEAKLQKQLLVKMEMARFLQETTHHLSKQLASSAKGLTAGEAKDAAEKFRDFMDAVRTGKKVRNADIIQFAKLFDSELTLDNLDQRQLEAMCRLLDIKVFGSLWVLRYKLEEKLRAIQKDDELIKKDGVAALNYSELQEACRARGIYTDHNEAYLRRKLSDWLELSLEKQVPITLLLLSRAFSRQMTGAAGSSAEDDMAVDLASTLAYVPAVAVAEAEKEAIDRTDDKAAKLKVLEDEAVEAAFEELQASKAGSSKNEVRAKVLSMKPAIGVTKEKLARLEEKNDDVEELIDETIAKHEMEEKETAKAGAADTAAAASATAAAAATQSSSSDVLPPPSADIITPAAAAVPSASVPKIVVSKSSASSGGVTLTDVLPPPSAAAATPAAAAAVSADAVDKPAPSTSAQKKKHIAVVDQLNDRVGKIIDEIKAQTEQLESKQQQQADDNKQDKK